MLIIVFHKCTYSKTLSIEKFKIAPVCSLSLIPYFTRNLVKLLHNEFLFIKNYLKETFKDKIKLEQGVYLFQVHPVWKSEIASTTTTGKYFFIWKFIRQPTDISSNSFYKNRRSVMYWWIFMSMVLNYGI